MHLLRGGFYCFGDEKNSGTTHRSLEEQVFGETGIFLKLPVGGTRSKSIHSNYYKA